MNPTQIYDTLELIRVCVCDAMDSLIGEEGVPDSYGCSCYSFVSAGEPAVDCCLEGIPCDQSGMLTVHEEGVFPSDVFPSPLEGFEPCKAATWVANVVVTASRCAPSMDEQGNAASPEDQAAVALVQSLDQYAILTALSCCVVNDPPPRKSKRRVLITGTRSLVSEGGCATIEVRAAVEVGVVCSCQPTTS